MCVHAVSYDAHEGLSCNFICCCAVGDKNPCEGNHHFLCHDNVTCILKSFQCDGEPDCPDASDELPSCGM